MSYEDKGNRQVDHYSDDDSDLDQHNSRYAPIESNYAAQSGSHLSVPGHSYSHYQDSAYNPFGDAQTASRNESFEMTATDLGETNHIGNTTVTGLMEAETSYMGVRSPYGEADKYQSFMRDTEQQVPAPAGDWGVYSFMQSLPVIGSRFQYEQPEIPPANAIYTQEENYSYEGNPYPSAIQGDFYEDHDALEIAPPSSHDSVLSLDRPAEEYSRTSTGMKRRPTKLVRKKRKDPADPFQSDEEKKLKYFILDRRFPDLLNTKLASKVDVNNEANKEFTHLRYSAITAAPSTFIRDGFKLRNNLRAFPRETELLIAVTMYNEHDILLGRTLQGIMENIKYMTSLKKSQTWGENSWKKIVVCVISDGRSKINPRAKALMTALGCYQEGFAKSVIDEKEVQAHLFETTSLINIQEVTETKVIFADTAKDIETNIPVQFVFCLKEKNAKKINSHRWFFQSFAKLLDPKITVLLDAGTKPDKKSLYNLWREFKTDENVAGACGEIKAQTGKATYKALLNPIIGAQNFEYKTSNILDKPLESSFGFISVLPGAFSAYRWLALDIDNPDGPLDKYFKGEFLHSNEAPELSDPDYEYKNLQKLKLKSQGIFTQNMYLAEDRILCFELVTAKKHKWVLRYVSSAVGETDVPSRLPEFILQRRRWLNGSFFAGTYSIINFNKFLSSGHSVIRKFFLVIEFIYQIVSLAVSWLSLASFFLVFRILSSATASGSASFTGSYQLSVVFLYLYVFLLVLTILLSFGNSPQGRSTAMIYNFIVGAFACIMIYMLFCIAWLVANFANQLVDYFKMIGGSLTIGDFARVPLLRDLVISLLSTYALYFFGAVLFLDMWHMLWSFWWYILLSPAYTNVLNIYAFCNIHDVSWGTKGDTGGKSLGSVKLDSDSNVANSSPIPDDKEVNKAYVEEMEILNTDFKDEEGSKKEDQVDKFAFVRTAVVVFWMITNFSLVAIVLNVGFNSSTTPSTSAAVKRADAALEAAATQKYPGLFENNTTKSGIFLTAILWLVVFLSCFRFLGALYYKFCLRLKVHLKAGSHA